MNWMTGLVGGMLFLVPLVAHADDISPGESRNTLPAVLSQSSPPRLGIGVKGGLGWVDIGGDDAENQFGNSVPKLGHAYGLVVSFEPIPRFGFQLELQSTSKGATVEDPTGMDVGTQNMSYLGGALLADVKIPTTSELRPYALAGVELGYLLESLVVGTSGTSLDLTADTTTLDVGVIAGAGLAWEIRPRHEIMMEARLDIGLRNTDNFEGSDDQTLNRSLLFMLGYRYWVLPGRQTMKDSDRDGIPDSRDRCVDAAEDVDGFKDDDGCPEPDNDGDGMLDAADRCPDEAEDKDGFQDEDGCPDPDNDGDGVNDAMDRCPEQAEDRNGVQDDDGCPDQDSDGDGVADVGDACPDKPGWWTDDGCARDYQTIAVEKDRISLQKGKRIEVARVRRSEAPKIARASEALLGEVARALAEHPRIRLRIGAHTDNTAGDDKSLPLSQEQAQAVRDYLVTQGVSAERLEARGYGSSVPIADNGTKVGRARNRRIELEIIALPAE